MPDNKTKYRALKRPEHKSLADIANDALVDAIVNQGFEPGAPVSIDGLAKRFAMSNTPVREALMRANGECLIRQKTNYGFVVADLHVHLHLTRLYAGVGLVDRAHSVQEHQAIIHALQREDLHGADTLFSQQIKRVEGFVESLYSLACS